MWPGDPSRIDLDLDSRAVTFENPSGARGGGGAAAGGRKGAPSRRVAPGERVVLADLEGPGTIRHVWMTVPPAPPQQIRAVWLEVFYDGMSEPSVSAPCLDLFGLPHGRPVAYTSALTSVQEGRGFNAWYPLPFRSHIRVELVNGGARAVQLYYQIDYTLETEVGGDRGYLHAGFRRENPTEPGRDFVIVDGLGGPGRFLGCVVGVRVLDEGAWYGEGEVKVYRDGDRELPTICGTGLEDYVGSAWGMGRHHALYAGAPVEVREPDGGAQPYLVGIYRWHVPDPIVFRDDLRVTIQQIGAMWFLDGQDEEFIRYAATHPVAGDGWHRHPSPGLLAFGIVERSDDYCATSFVYCREPQAVARLDAPAAVDAIERLPHERVDPMEQVLGALR